MVLRQMPILLIHQHLVLLLLGSLVLLMARRCTWSSLDAERSPAEGEIRLVALFSLLLDVLVGAGGASEDTILLGKVLKFLGGVTRQATLLFDKVFDFNRLLFSDLIEANELFDRRLIS